MSEQANTKDIVLSIVGRVLEDNMGNRVTIALLNGVLVHASNEVERYMADSQHVPMNADPHSSVQVCE